MQPEGPGGYDRWSTVQIQLSLLAQPRHCPRPVASGGPCLVKQALSRMCRGCYLLDGLLVSMTEGKCLRNYLQCIDSFHVGRACPRVLMHTLLHLHHPIAAGLRR